MAWLRKIILGLRSFLRSDEQRQIRTSMKTPMAREESLATKTQPLPQRRGKYLNLLLDQSEVVQAAIDVISGQYGRPSYDYSLGHAYDLLRQGFGSVVYAGYGVHRYIVYPDGRIVFSKEHGDGRIADANRIEVDWDYQVWPRRTFEEE